MILPGGVHASTDSCARAAWLSGSTVSTAETSVTARARVAESAATATYSAYEPVPSVVASRWNSSSAPRNRPGCRSTHAPWVSGVRCRGTEGSSRISPGLSNSDPCNGAIMPPRLLDIEHMFPDISESSSMWSMNCPRFPRARRLLAGVACLGSRRTSPWSPGGRDDLMLPNGGRFRRRPVRGRHDVPSVTSEHVRRRGPSHTRISAPHLAKSDLVGLLGCWA